MDKQMESNQDTIAGKPVQVKPSQKEDSSRSYLDKVVLPLLGKMGTIAGFLCLAIAALLHVVPQLASLGAFAQILSIVLAELGAVLLTVSTVHYAYEHYIRKQHEAQMLRLFEDAVRRMLCEPANLREIVKATRDDSKLIQGLTRHGVVGMLITLEADRFSEYFRKASKIRVLKTWFPESPTLKKAFADVLKNRNTSIEVLLCKPGSEVLRIRSGATDSNDEKGSERVRDALKQIHDIRCSGLAPDDSLVNCRVGLYETWPGPPIIWCDDLIFLGYYFFGMSSHHTPWIKVESGSQLGADLENQFKWLWGKADELKTRKELGKWMKPRRKRNRRRGRNTKNLRRDIVGDKALP